MKKYILFNLFIQIFMLIVSVELFYLINFIKFLVLLLLTFLIFLPTVYEKIFDYKLKEKNHFLFTFLCIIIFIILIVFL